MFLRFFKWWFRYRLYGKADAFAQKRFHNLAQAHAWIHVGPASILLRQGQLSGGGWSLLLEVLLINDQDANLGLDAIVLDVLSLVAMDRNYDRFAVTAPMIAHQVLKDAGLVWDETRGLWWKDIAHD